MRMKKFIFLLSLILLFSSTYAGGDVDTNYVQKFKSILSVKLFLNQHGYKYTITPRNNSLFTSDQLNNAKLIYTTNIPATAAIAINLKGFGFTYIFKFTDDFLDTTGKAKSDFKGFRMNFYKPKFGFEAYYQDYRRFYYHYDGDEKLLKNYNSDIRAYQWGANGVFIFNGQKFSYGAAFNQSQIQKKSAGSWMLIAAINFNEIKSGGSLIPDSVKKFYNRFDGLERNRNYSFIMQTGYAFNLTKNRFYLSGALLGGVGIQNQTYKYYLGTLFRTAFPLVSRSKVSVGYNGDIFFTGIYANLDWMQTSIKDVKTNQSLYSYGFYVGARFIKYSKTKEQLKQATAHDKWVKKEAAKKAKADAKHTKELKRKGAKK